MDESATRLLRELYWGKRLSIRKTAVGMGMSYQGTRKRLQKLGQLRSKSEGMMRYPRKSFSGDAGEGAYLLGLRAGDVNAWKKSPNTIEARVSTTHPAMSDLFSKSFGNYGHVMRFAERAFLPGRFRWQTKAHLDASFEFIVRKPQELPRGTVEFCQFLTGYSDSECCWSVFPDGSRIRVSWTVESYDTRLVQCICNQLKTLGYHPTLYQTRKTIFTRKNQTRTKGRRTKSRLSLGRANEVARLAASLLPYSLHAEKIEKMRLIIAHPSGEWDEIAQRVRMLRKEIQEEVEEYGKQAQGAYNTNRRKASPLGSSASLV